MKTTGILAAAALAMLAAATIAPFIAGRFGVGYLVIIVAGVLPPVVFSIAVALKMSCKLSLRRASAALKAAMPVGIAAVLAGFQGW